MGEIITGLGDNDIRGQVTEASSGVSAPGISLANIRNNPSACLPLIDPRRPRFWAPAYFMISRKIFGRGHRGSFMNMPFAVILLFLSVAVAGCDKGPRTVTDGADK